MRFASAGGMVVLVIGLITVMATGCGTSEKTQRPVFVEPTPQPADGATGPPGQLEPVEIREYEGKDLSAVDSFRENSIKGPQHVDIESYTLEVSGLVANPESYTYDQIVEGYDAHKKVVTLNCVEGWSRTILWEGMLVRELIAEAGPLPEANTVIFHAYDGYTTSFPIEYIMDNDIIMAYKMNDVVIPPERGFPFALVAESKWGYKWIKWITQIQLSNDPDYQGYWERRGYSNTGDLDEPFF